MEEAVYWSREGSVATITLNRPAQFNVMNTELSAGLRQALMECWDDEEVRAIILTGNGKAFSAGGDIKFFIEELRQQRIEWGIRPAYKMVDTCAAEFEAFTPYYYSSYGDENEMVPTDKRKIMILGGGPNRIGQGIEFDYCCVHAAFALHEVGYETIMVNSNPETVSTDYDTSDRLYFEPLTLEDVLEIYHQEKFLKEKNLNYL